jgi:hypothetical protein
VNKKQNIEDAFRSGFDGYTKTPSDKVWNGINKKMIGPRMESMYKNAFNGFKIAPTGQTWRRVAAALWFNRFIHFSPFSFNIYYLGIIITAVVGTVVSINNNRNLDFVHFSDPFENPAKLKTKQIVIEQTASTNSNLDLRNTETDYFELKEDENISNTIETNAITNTNNNNIIVNNNSQANRQTNNITETTIDIENIILENIAENIIETNIENSNVDNKENFIVKLERLIRFNTYNLTYNPTTSEIADAVINGIPKLDAISYDTIGVDYHGDPILQEKSSFIIDLYVSPYMHRYNNLLLNSELQNNFDLYDENINPCMSFSAGLGFAYMYKNIRFETGIGYHRMNETISLSTQGYESNSHTYYNYFDELVWQEHIVHVLDLDEYLQGNIVYIEHVDSVLTFISDSTLITYTDSTLVSENLNAENSFSFIDIPIIGGYEFNFGKISLTPKAGIIGSILIKREGTCYDITSRDITDVQAEYNSGLLLDYYTAINLQYKMGKHISLYIEPNLRGDITSVYKNNFALDQKSNKFGLRTGVYIKF